jgi:hypothetical protein
VCELLKKEKTEGYKELIDEDWVVVKSRPIGSVEEEWESFIGTILRILEEVCGLRKVRAGGSKSEWWCTEIAVAVREKRDAFVLWPYRKDSREEYERKSIDARTIIVECKREVNRRWGEQVASEFKKSKKIFKKSITRNRTPKYKLDELARDEKGKILHENEQVAERWSEYFVTIDFRHY